MDATPVVRTGWTRLCLGHDVVGFILVCWLVYAVSGRQYIKVHEDFFFYFSDIFLLFYLGNDARRLPVASLLHNGTALTTK